MTSHFLWGALAMSSVVAALFFLRFWKRTRDRLFLIFSAAFWVMTANWIGAAVVNPQDDSRHYLFILRLVAFVLIIVAVVDKTRRR